MLRARESRAEPTRCRTGRSARGHLPSPRAFRMVALSAPRQPTAPRRCAVWYAGREDAPHRAGSACAARPRTHLPAAMPPFLKLSAALLLLPTLAAGQAPDRESTVVLDASAFIDEIQKDHVLTDAGALDVPWIFNNTALEMRTRSNYVIRAEIPTAGRYHLYARTQGRDGSFFRVAIGDEVIGRDVGNAPLRLERVGEFELAAGPVDIRLMRIEGRPVLDVLALSREADLT